MAYRVWIPSSLQVVMSLSCLAGLISCGGGGEISSPPAVASVTVTLAATSLVIGETTQATATLRDAAGAVLSGRTTAWATDDGSIATVSSAGLVTAISAGSTVIRATSEGKAGSATIAVTLPPVATVTVTLAATSLVIGETTQATATLRDAAGAVLSGRTTAWATDDGSIATVSSAGLVTAISAGSTVIRATSEGKAGSVSILVTRGPLPRILVQPASSVLTRGQRATFSLIAESTTPIAYQWRRNGELIPAATSASYTTDPAIRADSGVVYSVDVANAFGTVTSEDALLRVTGVTVYGLSGFRPNATFPDITGVRFTLRLAENSSQSVKLMFGTSRFYTPNGLLTYLVETNVYSGTQRFADGACGTWPLVGTYVERQGSLRLAIPDYNYSSGAQAGITTGIRATDAVNYPIQTYLIDGIGSLFKSDAITQFDLAGVEIHVTLERAGVITDASPYARCGRPLLPTLYRLWNMKVAIAGRGTESIDFVMPDAFSRFLTSSEPINLYSEFLHTAGTFTVQYSDFALRRESTGSWQSISEFVTGGYDGNGSDFGVRVVQFGGRNWVELSNRSGGAYFKHENQLFSY